MGSGSSAGVILRASVALWMLLAVWGCREPSAPPAAEPTAPSSAAVSAPVVAPLPGPAREVSRSDEGAYPKTVGQALDYAIYRAAYEAISPLSDAAGEAGVVQHNPDTETRPRGTVVTLFFEGNVNGETEDCGCKKNPMGGLTRKASTIASELASGDPLDRPDAHLFVDAGDLLFKSPQARALQPRDRKAAVIGAEAMIEGLELIGIDAVAAGTHDLAIGLEDFQRLRKAAKFPFVSANLRKKGERELLLAPFVVREVGGLRLALLGLTDDGPRAMHEDIGVEVDNPRDALLAQAPALREARVDGVILLSNLGFAKTEQLLPSLGVGSPPVAVAFVSGTRRTTFQPVWTEQSVPILESGPQGKHLGRLDLHVIEGGLRFESGKTTWGRAATQYLTALRSLHNGRRALADLKPDADAERVARVKRNLDLSVQRLAAIEKELPEAKRPDPAAAPAPASWVRARMSPLPTSLPEDARVRAILDKHKKRVAALPAAKGPTKLGGG